MDGERELRRGERRVAPGAQILVERGVAHVFDTPAFAADEVVVSLSGQFVDRRGAVEAAACEYAGFEKHLHGVVYSSTRYALAVFLENTTKPLDRKMPFEAFGRRQDCKPFRRAPAVCTLQVLAQYLRGAAVLVGFDVH